MLDNAEYRFNGLLSKAIEISIFFIVNGNQDIDTGFLDEGNFVTVVITVPPFYVFSGEYLLSARLRPSNIDGCLGTEEILENLVGMIRAQFPDVRIIFRGDSGFCRESILSCCELLRIKYMIGLAKNPCFLFLAKQNI